MDKVVHQLNVTIELRFDADDAPPKEMLERQLEKVLHDWLESIGANVIRAEWRKD